MLFEHCPGSAIDPPTPSGHAPGPNDPHARLPVVPNIPITAVAPHGAVRGIFMTGSRIGATIAVAVMAACLPLPAALRCMEAAAGDALCE
jgi:hypothetical protein